MLFWEMVLVALQSIKVNFFRAILTMLGIIIGVAAVISMVALGTGAQQAINSQLDSLGGNILSVSMGWGGHKGVATDQKLNIRDAKAIERSVLSATAVVPETAGRIQVKLGNKNRNINIVGTTPNYADVNSYKLLYGRMFTESENSAKKRVVVLGGELPATFETDATMLIGQSLMIKGTAYKIIGIFEEKGSVGFTNNDSNAWVPLSTAQFRLTGNDKLDKIGVQISPDVPIEVAIIDVERVMRKEHQIIPGGKNDFMLGDRKMFLNMQADAAEIFSYLLAGIAGISLIVGGIGIMNIMLVTVTERTREIGIRKALGATKMNILLQFLVEAMILCIVGGLIGIALGATAATLLASLAGWSTPLSVSAVAIAFCFSAGVGLLFGLLPARKAASLDPIEALRFE
ncbi:MAG: FtsX-like permease family protein [Gammaproteobacteria bacterium]|nr:FtsX-like permease family protein [Gammaproteobacteria bacterium]MCP4089430.1 FtsX-like permease family protein [Gammaproteobacteria bacterium]MCP4277546.1 FtsX-like permease family protein [Gammaproteobacteria bacterium]MCP4831154.1 FtsX-like permease family protein [Gammaproteobacteria bacterium]MCP4929217.1 FtsX-like permease family protein [Gammaproteobacteria bacterium]